MMRLELYVSIAGLLWVRFRAPRGVQDIVGFGIFTVAVWFVAFYCLVALGVRLRDRVSSPFLLFATAKPRYWFYLGVISIALSFALDGVIGFNLVTKRHQVPQILWGLALCCFVIGIFASWLGAYQLRLSESLIEYWSLFGGYRALITDEIQQARIRIGWFSYWDRYKPTMRLELLSACPNNKRDVIVNLKVFRQEDIDRVFDWLGPKLEDAGELSFRENAAG